MLEPSSKLISTIEKWRPRATTGRDLVDELVHVLQLRRLREAEAREPGTGPDGVLHGEELRCLVAAPRRLERKAHEAPGIPEASGRRSVQALQSVGQLARQR